MSKTVKSSSGLLIFGIVWTAFSSIFAVIGIKLCYDGYHRSGWPKTECTVTHFRVSTDQKNDPAFQPKVKYTYEWEGVTHTGDRVWANSKGEDKYEDLAELVEQYRNRELTTCHVNPDAPEESVLIPASSDIWGGVIFAIFGIGFMCIGIGMVASSRRQKKNEHSALSSKKGESDAPPVILIPFFSIFALAGLGVLIFVVVPQWIKYHDAKGWTETPATVIWSRVESRSDGDGTTHSANIFYRYTFEGKQYSSNTLGLLSSSSSGRAGKLEKVNAHPRDKKISCYVNPEKPWQALLERDLGWWALFALFPLPFIAIGVGGLWWLLRNRSKKRKKHSSSINHKNRDITKKDDMAGKLKLKPGGKRISWLFGSIALALFWNGITSVFVWQAIQSWQGGNPDWFLTIFITPFVLIGIGFITHIFYRLLAVLNPSTTLTLAPGELTLDEPAKLTWITSGNRLRFSNFAIYLVGEEEAQFRRGTDTVTETEVFYELALIETLDPRDSLSGSASINLPANTLDLMPSWKSSNNRIRWSIHVKAKISAWPDVLDKYDITVNPVDIEA